MPTGLAVYGSDRLVLEFDPQLGYVRVKPVTAVGTDDKDDDDDADYRHPWIATGTWSLESPGLSISIPLACPVQDDNNYNNNNNNNGDGDQSDPTCAKSNTVILQHRLEADLHLNPFGRHAKLTRGVVLRERRRGTPAQAARGGGWYTATTWWWQGRRDVVGTFSGRGTGPDTVDLSYAARKAPRQ